MKNLVIYQGIQNYYRIDNKHIFINFNKESLEYIKSNIKGSKNVFHIIITNHESINDSLKTFIGTYGGKRYKKDGTPTNKKNSKIIIHVPWRIKHLKKLVDNFLCGIFLGKYEVMVDRRNIEFRLDEFGWKNYKNLFTIDMQKDHIEPKIQRFHGSYRNPNDGEFPKVKFPIFLYETPTEKEKTIFSSVEQRINPEVFKEELIKSFKEQVPITILESFRNDDDIWNYITMSEDWAK